MRWIMVMVMVGQRKEREKRENKKFHRCNSFHPQDRELRSDKTINDTRQQEQTQPVRWKTISRSMTESKKAFPLLPFMHV